MLTWLTLALALAQTPDPLLADVDYESVARAEVGVSVARERLDQAVRDLGYGSGLRLGERTHHRNQRPFKGGVMIHDQGFARIHVPRFTLLPGMAEDPVPKAARIESQLLQGPPPTRFWGVTFLIGGRRWRMGRQTAIATALEPHLRAYREALWEQEQAWKLLELHAQLDRAWEAGIAPDGTPIGDRPEDRRAWLVARLRDTAENAAGYEVRRRISEFITLRVQVSDHPFSEAELATLDLPRP